MNIVLLLAMQLVMPKIMQIKVLEVKAPGDFTIQDTTTKVTREFKTCNDKTDFTVGHDYSVAYQDDPKRGCSQIVGLKQLD